MGNDDVHIEILELAISREIEAVKLYLSLAEHFADQQISKECIEIANEELAHKKNLELEVMKFGHTIETEQEFVCSSASGGDPIDDIMREEMDHKDLLIIAISKEEESFRFYVDMLGLIEDDRAREVLYALAREEVLHKRRFETQYDLISEK